MKRIHLISGPRNISTALMYSFGNRSDCKVVDEPFYAYYIKGHPQIVHPGMDEVLKSQDTDFDHILKNVIFGEVEEDIYFIKNMAHHLDGSDWHFLNKLSNVFLVRDPRQLIASFSRVIKNPTMLDIALKLEYDILEYCMHNKAEFLVVDSNDILHNPESGLKKLCAALDIPFSPSMIQWEAGRRDEDGVWEKYWYSSVHKSTGFQPQSSSTYAVPEHLVPLLKEAQFYYDKMQSKKINLIP